ncbi:acetate--CoA ligase family protein [Geoglobus sp.]
MDGLFYPESIAVIGATPRRGKVGNTILRNLKSSFRGEIIAVNPNYEEVDGVRCYGDVSSMPRVDLAVVVTPARSVPGILEEIGKKGIRNAVVISAGFREAGVEGMRLENRVAEIAERYGINLVGPNCLGVINTDIGLNATFSREVPDSGNIAFLSQSGAFILAVIDWAKHAGIGFSKVISLGNKAVLDEVDFIRYLATDEQTEVIVLYLESVSRGREFMRVVESVFREKPVIVLKSGRTESGSRAASSHTGSLAGNYEIYRAAFDQCGAVVAETVEELFDFALTLSRYRRGGKLAIITNSGGPGVIASDFADTYGVEMARFESKTVEELRKVLPPHSGFYNPVDILGDANSERFGKALKIVENDGNVGVLMTILTPSDTLNFTECARFVLDARKPVITCMMGGRSVEDAVRVTRAKGIPNFFDPARAIRAIKVVEDYSRMVGRRREEHPEIHANRETAREFIMRHGPGYVGLEAMELLSAYGIPVAKWGIARTPEEAREVADRIGYPVALKVLSPDIVHKSDAGGVRLNVSESEVERAFREMMLNIERKFPHARVDGVLVQEMVGGGVEVIVGVKRDPSFGPVIMFGLGGVFVEVFRDVTFRVAPLSRRDAMEMIKKVRAYRLLSGYRGAKRMDISSLADVLVRVSVLAVENEEVVEMDLNPVKVLESGCVVVDARMVLEGREDGQEHSDLVS